MEFFRRSIRAWLISTLALAVSSATSSAAVVSLVRESRPASAAELAAGAPAGGVVHDFFITSQSDLLSISGVTIDAPLYRHQLGSDHRLSAKALVEQDASVGASSFIQMPGETLVLGGGFGGGAESLWGDLTDDGAQQDFLFARLTTTDVGSFTGSLAVRTDFGFETLSYKFDLPTLASLDSLGGAQAIHLEYTPLPPTPLQPALPPVIESPIIEPPVVAPEVPAIEIVDVLPPEVDPILTEPEAPAAPSVEDPQPGDASEVVFEIGHESIVSIIDAVNTTGWIDLPPRSVSFINWRELVGGIELIQLVDYSSTSLLGDLVAADVTSINSTDIIDMQVQIFSFSADASAGIRFFASSTSATSEGSVAVPEPNMVLLGFVAVAVTAEFNRRCWKTGSATLNRL